MDLIGPGGYGSTDGSGSGSGSDNDAPLPTMEGGSGEGNTSGTGGLADDNGVEGSGHGEHTTNEAMSGSAHGAGACGGGSFSSSSSTAFTAATTRGTILRNHSHSERSHYRSKPIYDVLVFETWLTISMVPDQHCWREARPRLAKG